MILLTTFAGGVAGFLVGWWLGEREGGDFNFMPVVYGPLGGMAGGAIGVIAGYFIF